jgi:hypothetical protein
LKKPCGDVLRLDSRGFDEWLVEYAGELGLKVCYVEIKDSKVVNKEDDERV